MDSKKVFLVVVVCNVWVIDFGAGKWYKKMLKKKDE